MGVAAVLVAVSTPSVQTAFSGTAIALGLTFARGVSLVGAWIALGWNHGNEIFAGLVGLIFGGLALAWSRRVFDASDIREAAVALLPTGFAGLFSYYAFQALTQMVHGP